MTVQDKQTLDVLMTQYGEVDNAIKERELLVKKFELLYYDILPAGTTVDLVALRTELRKKIESQLFEAKLQGRI
jgi:hypothetical protein